MSGSTIWRKMREWLAPSTRAASMSSRGSSEMKLCSRNTPIGSEKHRWANHTSATRCTPTSSSLTGGSTVTLPIETPWVNRRSSGTSAICSGTICSAKMPMNTHEAPLNGIQASAYAANAARARANSTVGTVIMREFMK